MSEPKYTKVLRQNSDSGEYYILDNCGNIHFIAMDNKIADDLLAACNNYDKAVELLKWAKDELENRDIMEGFRNKIDQFLTEVNDDTKV